jgi:hypothetical protein
MRKARYLKMGIGLFLSFLELHSVEGLFLDTFEGSLPGTEGSRNSWKLLAVPFGNRVIVPVEPIY